MLTSTQKYHLKSRESVGLPIVGIEIAKKQRKCRVCKSIIIKGEPCLATDAGSICCLCIRDVAETILQKLPWNKRGWYFLASNSFGGKCCLCHEDVPRGGYIFIMKNENFVDKLCPTCFLKFYEEVKASGVYEMAEAERLVKLI